MLTCNVKPVWAVLNFNRCVLHRNMIWTHTGNNRVDVLRLWLLTLSRPARWEFINWRLTHKFPPTDHFHINLVGLIKMFLFNWSGSLAHVRLNYHLGFFWKTAVLLYIWTRRLSVTVGILVDFHIWVRDLVCRVVNLILFHLSDFYQIAFTATFYYFLDSCWLAFSRHLRSSHCVFSIEWIVDT